MARGRPDQSIIITGTGRSCARRCTRTPTSRNGVRTIGSRVLASASLNCAPRQALRFHLPSSWEGTEAEGARRHACTPPSPSGARQQRGNTRTHAHPPHNPHRTPIRGFSPRPRPARTRPSIPVHLPNHTQHVSRPSTTPPELNIHASPHARTHAIHNERPGRR